VITVQVVLAESFAALGSGESDAVRLAAWCRTMRDLYLQVEHDPRSRCPVHLVEKAYRWADRVAGRMKEGPLRRSTPPDTVGEAIRNLEALNQWCDDLARILPTG